MSDGFRERYGPWALVAGASEGIGEAFALELASKGLNLILVARRPEPLDALATRLRASGVDVRTAAFDLGDAAMPSKLAEATRGLDVGLVVYNAARAFIGEFLSQSLDDKLAMIDVNVRGPMIVADAFGRSMAARGRGGLLFMTSLAGLQGSPIVASYAATKAFNLVLGEGLWEELGRKGVDVVACCAGATRTPGFERSRPRGGPPPTDPRDVARVGLASLGRRPRVFVGWLNRFAAFVMTRLLPRRVAVGIMASQSRKMYGVGG